MSNPKEGFSSSNPSYCLSCNRLRKRRLQEAKTGRPVKPRNRWVDDYKNCSKCGVRKHKNEFQGLTTKSAWCKQCTGEHNRIVTKTDKSKEQHRTYARKWYRTEKGLRAQKDSHLKSTYGITYADKMLMLEQQGNRCPICHTSNPGKRGWVVDHCHRFGKIRAILCDTCNKMLGFAKDHPITMLAGMQYLIKHQFFPAHAVMSIGIPKSDEEWEDEMRGEV